METVRKILSISEKHDRLTIRHKFTKRSKTVVCENCKNTSDHMTVKEAAIITGKNVEEIKNHLNQLRNEIKPFNERKKGEIQ